MIRHSIQKLTYLSLLVFISAPLYAENKHMAVYGDWPYWSIAERWSPTGVPTLSDDVFLGYQAIDTSIAFVYSVAEMNSLSLTSAFNLVSEGTMEIDDSLQLTNNASINLYYVATINIGGNGSNPSLSLTNNSLIDLHSAQFPQGASTINVTGELYVDGSSQIQGEGQINAAGEINLNGTLKPEQENQQLVLAYTSTTPNAAEVDLDGDNESGVLDASVNNTKITVPGQMADPFSGEIKLGSGSEIQFSGAGSTFVDTLVSVPPGPPPVISGDQLFFTEDAEILLNSAELFIEARSLDVGGLLTVSGISNTFHADTLFPWRLRGTLDNGYDTAIFGSPMIVGSDDGEAHIDSREPLYFYTPVTLENSAVINGRSSTASSGAFCTLEFKEALVLQSPSFNEEYAPWNPSNEYIPSGVKMLGDVLVQGDTTVYATAMTIGSSLTTSTSVMSIEPGRHLSLDAKTYFTNSNTSVYVDNAGELTLVARDPSANYWINKMDITLTNAELSGSDICNTGSILGSGTINANLLPSAGSTVCGGFVSPGFSPGLLTINGDAHFQNTQFLMEIAGAKPVQYDRLHVRGALDIAKGLLEIRFIDGYTPRAGDVFKLFQSDHLGELDFSRIRVKGLPNTLTADPTTFLEKGALAIVRKDRPHRFPPKKTKAPRLKSLKFK